MPQSLWPIIDEPAVRTIGDILREAGEDLPQHTSGRVRYRVDSRLGGDDAEEPSMIHECVLYVPGKEGLEYTICEVRHDPMASFPATLHAFASLPLTGDGLLSLRWTPIAVANESDLIAKLTKVFWAPATVQLIRNFMAAAKSS
jgi:hypothetical protein